MILILKIDIYQINKNTIYEIIFNTSYFIISKKYIQKCKILMKVKKYMYRM